MRFKDHLLRRVVFFIYQNDRGKDVDTRDVDLQEMMNAYTNFKQVIHFYSSGKNIFAVAERNTAMMHSFQTAK